MPFDHIQGQDPAIGTLTRALRTGHVHHALRFEGPDGVGKELAAMALAQALLCTSGDPLGCGQCSACKRVVTFAEGTPSVPVHPDVILIERGLYPPEILGRSRAEAQEVSVDQIRTVVLPRMSFPPHEGRARVFIVRRADELSTSAANALLKTLEEPGAGTHFVLLTTRPAKLISTVRSRSFRIRFAPLPDAVIRGILAQRGIEEPRASTIVLQASGSASFALSLADSEASATRDAFVDAAMKAVEANDMEQALALAEARSRDKSHLRENLEALGARLALTAKSAIASDAERAKTYAVRYQVVLQAVRELDRNASPALLIESMMLRLRAATG